MAAAYRLIQQFIEATESPEGASKEKLMALMQASPEGGSSRASFERMIAKLRKTYHLLLEYDQRNKVYRLQWNGEAQRLMHLGYQMQMCQLTQTLQETPEYIDFGILPSERGMSNFDDLGKAIQNRHWIRITYKAFYNTEAKEYELKPLFLRLWNNRWYLISKKRGEEGFRNFGLERIQTLVSLRERFELDKGETKEAYAHIIGVSDAHLSAEDVVIETSLHGANFLGSLKLHASQHKEIVNPDVYRIHLRVVPNRELMEILTAMNQPVRIVSPASFRQAFCERLRKQLEVNSEISSS